MGSPLPVGLHGDFLNTYGGIFMGNLIAAIVFGVVSVQTMRYFHVFRRDRSSTRAVVAFLWLVLFFQLSCIAQSMWRYFIRNFGNVLPMKDMTWEFILYQTGCLTTSVTVQTFFAIRVFSLSNSILLGAAVELFVLSQCAFGLAVSVTMNQIRSPQRFVEKYSWLSITWFALRASADLIICSTMAFLLRSRRTGFKHSDTAVNLMILWTINTGVMTAMTSVTILAVFARAGFHYLMIMISLPHSGFYVVSMMANLHSRTKILEIWNTPHSLPANEQCWHMVGLSPQTPNSGKNTTPCLTETSDGTIRSQRQFSRIPVIIDITREREMIDDE